LLETLRKKEPGQKLMWYSGNRRQMRCLLVSVVVLFVVGWLVVVSSEAKLDPKAAMGIWLFDEIKDNVAKDSSDNKNDGKLMGNPKEVDGKFGQALEFNGVADYIDLPPLPEQTDEPLSVTALIKWGGSTATTRGVWGYTNVATVNCHFEIQAAGMRLRLGGINKTGMTSPPVKEWAAVAFTYDGNTERYYLNGVEVGSNAGKTGTVFGAEAALGHIVGVSDAGRFFDGLIDEAAIFNETLAEDEIKTIMNDGLAKTMGLTPVFPAGKLTTTWADIKQ
jgi:hypothetical protein